MDSPNIIYLNSYQKTSSPKKSIIEPVLCFRKRDLLTIANVPEDYTHHYYKKMERILFKHGLWHNIIIDETDAIIAGIRTFKTFGSYTKLVPVVLLADLSPAEKSACRERIKIWHRNLAYEKIWEEERRYEQ